jgi:UDP-glucose 4-epimerase
MGWRVVGVDSLTPYYDPKVKRMNAAAWARRPGCSYLEDDLLEIDLSELLADVDIVFHLAAQAGVRTGWAEGFDLYTQLNVTLVQRLLEAAKNAKLERLVFTSSSSVYGDAESLPTREESVLRPVSPYGATKALGEHLAYLYWKAFGLKTVSLRLFTVYGPRQRPDMALNRLIAAGLAGHEFVLYGNGDQTRDFTFVTDTITGMVAAAERGTPGAVYNVGGGTRTSMNDVIRTIIEIVGQIRVRRVEAERGDVSHTAADISRARAELGYSPTIDMASGLRSQVDWQRELEDRQTLGIER